MASCQGFRLHHALPAGCAVCGHKDDLLICSGCKALPYCGRDCQIADRPAHKAACSAIRKARNVMEHEEQKLRDHPGDVMMSKDPFTSCVGHFWGVFETRDYMRARYRLVRNMESVDHVVSVTARLDHCMDLLRLCRGDNMGVRSLVPGLLIRLQRDQDSYDFIKWWANTLENSNFDWGDTSLPYLDVKDADMFESVERFCHSFFDLSHRTCVCLLKIRLLLELVRLEQSTDSLGPSPHPVISAMLKSPNPISSAVGASQAIMSSDSNARKAMIDTLKQQIDALYEAVQKANEHFWHNLTDPDVDLDNMPSSYTRGSVEESQLTVGDNFFAWVETPGALAFIVTKFYG
ncbi:MYND-type domain-containing protein [Penicillium ucsense]|uniref:MYND-type domain-containing protein n=1 Tax=Penicillium ucsense TaxID=2839758 RepID=A0A8J8VX25_9EURO|nr:MYND-type domain-containing protein [Penicillium ucsense]KAF7726637.1 MYND-type domain-containing protein [Penicillium ucsense]